MANAPGNLETEIKLHVTDLDRRLAKIEDAGYRIVKPRMLESNTLFDLPGDPLRGRGELLRLRRLGEEAVITFKGPPQESDRFKSRLEIESQVSEYDALQFILQKVGLRPIFRYEKYRTEWRKPDVDGLLTVDETPIGNYLELEGAAEWIDHAAGELGFAPCDYLTKSYGTLFREYRVIHQSQSADMLFEG